MTCDNKLTNNLPVGVIFFEASNLIKIIKEKKIQANENYCGELIKPIKTEAKVLFSSTKLLKIFNCDINDSNDIFFIDKILCNSAFLTELIFSINSNSDCFEKTFETFDFNKEKIFLNARSDLTSFYQRGELILLIDYVAFNSFLSDQQKTTKYQMILDHTQSIHLTLNTDLQIIEFSEIFCKLLGVNSQSVSNKNIKHFICTESFKEFEVAISNVMIGYKINSLELKMVGGNNSYKWFSINVGALFNGTTKIFMLLTDITEKKEKELKNLEKKQKNKAMLKKEIFDLKNLLASSIA